MIDAEPLPPRPGHAVDADEWSLHHRVLYRLVLGCAGRTTAEIQLLYEALAPVVYRGCRASSTRRRWRRKVLNDLQDAGVIEAHQTPRGQVWTPTEDVLEADADAEQHAVGRSEEVNG